MATQELVTLNSVLNNKDISTLFKPGVDDLFEAYGDVWESVKSYYGKYRDIPDIEVLQMKFPELEKIETHGSTDFHLEQLKSEYISGRIEQLVLKAGSKIRPETAELVLNGLQQDLNKLNRFSHSVRDVDIMDMEEAERHYDELRQRAEEMGGTPGISTGIGFIDACIPAGLQPGDTTCIIGYPARGKSQVGALLGANFYNNGFKPMVASLEMPSATYRDRVYTVMGSGLFKNSELSVGIMDKDNFRTFMSKVDNRMQFPVIEGEGEPMTPNDIQAKINEHRPDIVILDYLQLMHDNARSVDMTARVRQLSLEIKQIAKANRLHVIEIAAATPEGVGRVSGPPSENSIAWSRQPSYDASLVISVHKDHESNMIEVEGTKNRYGPLFAGFLDWDIDNGILREVFDIG